MEFKVVQNHRDCISRLIHESVLIEAEGSMNSKTEWRSNSRPKLMIELSECQKNKQTYLQNIEAAKDAEKVSIVSDKVKKFDPKGTWLEKYMLVLSEISSKRGSEEHIVDSACTKSDIVGVRDRPIHLEPILTDTDSYRF